MIYDCFTFYNELDLLEIRLNELDSVVDYFVIVEGSKTFQNNLKPFYFLENHEKFLKFKSKIIRIEIPPHEFCADSWKNEKMSWNYIKHGLTNLKENDHVIISSLDEIPDPMILKEIIYSGMEMPVCMSNQFYYFYLNTKYTNGDRGTSWLGSYITTYKNLNKDNIYSFVEDRKQTPSVNGGWHFSFLGDANDAVNKCNSYGHCEFKHLTKEHYEYSINNLKDPLGRNSVYNFHSFESIENLPKYVQNNLEKFKKYIRV